MEKTNICTSFTNLPFEVIAHIFSFLSFSTLQKARLISRQWYEASLDHGILNREKLLIDARFTDQDSLISQVKECNRHFLHLEVVNESSVFHDDDFWCKLGPRLESFYLSLCHIRETDLIKVLNYCPKLKHLGVTNCKILVSPDQHVPSDALSDMVNLQHLDIRGYDFPSSILKVFEWTAAKAPKLKKLFFVDCLADSKDNYPRGLTCEHILTYLKSNSDRVFDLGFDVSKEYMHDDELIKLVSLPNILLRMLNTNFFPRPIYSTFQFCVQVLVLKALLHLDESMFESICSNFPNLRELTLDDMSEISTAVRKLSLLRNLTFLSLSAEFGYVEESDLVAGLCLEVNTTLREFHMQVANEMSSVFYIEFARTHPALSSLKLSSSESLDDWAIQAFFKHTVFLESLSIREVNAIDIGWIGALISAPLNVGESENPTGFPITRLKGLRVLDISRSPINVSILEHLIAQLPTIEILRIAQLPITDDFLDLVGEKLPYLTEININGCSQVTKIGIKCLLGVGVRKVFQ